MGELLRDKACYYLDHTCETIDKSLIQSGSGEPNKKKVATISKEDIQKIAETKMPDLNAGSLEAAMSMIAGTARSMGITVEEQSKFIAEKRTNVIWTLWETMFVNTTRRFEK